METQVPKNVQDQARSALARFKHLLGADHDVFGEAHSNAVLINPSVGRELEPSFSLVLRDLEDPSSSKSPLDVVQSQTPVAVDSGWTPKKVVALLQNADKLVVPDFADTVPMAIDGEAMILPPQELTVDAPSLTAEVKKVFSAAEVVYYLGDGDLDGNSDKEAKFEASNLAEYGGDGNPHPRLNDSQDGNYIRKVVDSNLASLDLPPPLDPAALAAADEADLQAALKQRREAVAVASDCDSEAPLSNNFAFSRSSFLSSLIARLKEYRYKIKEFNFLDFVRGGTR